MRGTSSGLVAWAAVLWTVGGACLTTYNHVEVTRLPDAPQLARRPEGCHVDVLDSGQTDRRPHREFGRVQLDWPPSKVKEQGPEGAIATLKVAACEHGAFLVTDLRALTTGRDGGLVYDATFATLLDVQGEPLNLERADAGPP